MHISKEGGRVVAKDIETMFGSIDDGICDATRLATSVLETNKGSNIPPAMMQKALDGIASGIAKAVDGRRDMVHAQRALIVIKDKSNLAETDYGCWGVGVGEDLIGVTFGA